MNAAPRYPRVGVEMTGRSISLLTPVVEVADALEQAGVAPQVVDTYMEDATKAAVQAMLAVAAKWVSLR